MSAPDRRSQHAVLVVRRRELLRRWLAAPDGYERWAAEPGRPLLAGIAVTLVIALVVVVFSIAGAVR